MITCIDCRMFFIKLIENHLKLKPEKCRFFQTEVSFLGHTVTPNGVKKDDKKIESIKEWYP